MSHNAPIAVFGGTFNPVHNGHLRAAVDVFEVLGIDDFRLLPCGQPPHRSGGIAAAEHRLAMLQRAVAACGFLSIDERELHRPGPSYMVDTLADIRQHEAPSSLVLIIGQDSANFLDRWHHWEQLFELANLVVMRRAGSEPAYPQVVAEAFRARRIDSPALLKEQVAGAVLQVRIDSLPVSASLVRNRIATGRSAHFLLPASVLSYIEAQGLYQA